MDNPSTGFRIRVVLKPDLPFEILSLLTFMLGNKAGQRYAPKDIVVPPQHFFSNKEWMLLFQQSLSTLQRRADRTLVLLSTGSTTLEEQDIGLFLRWLRPYVLNKGRRPCLIAVVRNNARPSRNDGLSYHCVGQSLSVTYNDRPLLSIKNFQVPLDDVYQNRQAAVN